MKINFKLTKKDYWSYNHFSIFHVKNIRRIFIATPVLVFTLTIAAGFIFPHNNWPLLLGIAIGVPAFYVLTIYFPMAKGVMSIPEDKLVDQSIEFSDEKKQLIHTFGGKQKKYNKSNVLQFRKSRNHVFITLESFSAIIIPEGSGYTLDEIMAKLKEMFG